MFGCITVSSMSQTIPIEVRDFDSDSLVQRGKLMLIYEHAEPIIYELKPN